MFLLVGPWRDSSQTFFEVIGAGGARSFFVFVGLFRCEDMSQAGQSCLAFGKAGRLLQEFPESLSGTQTGASTRRRAANRGSIEATCSTLGPTTPPFFLQEVVQQQYVLQHHPYLQMTQVNLELGFGDMLH